MSAPPSGFDIVIGNPPYVRQEEIKELKPVIQAQGYTCYTGTADLYVYFFERALQLLRTGGVLSFITSNKYLRAAYGERLRTYLLYATHPRVILDFGDSPVFTSIAYPCIIVTEKVRSVPKGELPSPEHFQIPQRIQQLLDAPDRTLRVLTWNPGNALPEFPDIFDAQAQPLAQRDLKPDGWRLESSVKLRLLERLRASGQPLGDYVQGRFYYGIKTGLNEAFVVDRATRDRLIAEHPSSAEVLKPFLRGRDVKRWRCEFQDLWLIFTRRGIDIKKYPAILEHLKPFRKRLTPGVPGGRKPGSYEWYEIQDSIDYWREFEQPKVVYPDIYEHQSFAWDTTGAFLGNTCYFIPGVPVWFVGLLNSHAVEWFYTHVANRIRGGYLRAFSDYMQQIPIPAATPEQQRWCERLAEALIWLHGGTGIPACASPITDKNVHATQRDPLLRQFLERLLDGLVYELFFPAELHARALMFFDLLARSNPPGLGALAAARRLPELRCWFEVAYDIRSPLRAALHDLSSLEVVRIIEEPAASSRPASHANPTDENSK